MPAPWIIEGGGGLWTIWGLGFIRRLKKFAHIVFLILIVSLYNFPFDTTVKFQNSKHLTGFGMYSVHIPIIISP